MLPGVAKTHVLLSLRVRVPIATVVSIERLSRRQQSLGHLPLLGSNPSRCLLHTSSQLTMETVLEATLNGTKSSPPLHPYYPLEVEIAGYIANEYSVIQLLLAFGSGCAVILSVTYVAAKRIRSQIPTSELLTLMWFVLSKLGRYLQCFPANPVQADASTSSLKVQPQAAPTYIDLQPDPRPGYYAYNFKAMGGRQDLFGQLWKEYAYSDSRYLTQNAFVMCMESITAVRWTALHQRTCMLTKTLVTDLLGPSILHRGAHDHHGAPIETSAASDRFARPAIRRCSVLCH